MGKVPGAPGYLALSIGIRMVGLPAILLRATTGSSAPDWRSPLPVVAASAVAVLVYGAGRLLAEGGVSLFGIRAGPRLVVEGPYAALRNPQDLGSTLPALAAPIALDAAVLWAVPSVRWSSSRPDSSLRRTVA